MNDRSLRRYVLASLTLTLAPTGCATLLGLDDFKEGPGAGGAGGATGSSSGMETVTSGSSSGGGGMSGTGGGCMTGTSSPCYTGSANTRGVGKCMDGTWTCQTNGMYGVCLAETLPLPEDCKVQGDENCDGISCSDEVWGKIFGDANEQHPTSVAVDSMGNIAVAGYFYGTLALGGTTLISAGSRDYFLTKLSSTGSVLWAKQFGDAADNGNKISVAFDSNGKIAIVGGLKGSAKLGNTTLTSGGGEDVFAALFDENGTAEWAKRFGDAANQGAKGIAMTAQGDLILVGGFSGTIDFGGPSLTSAGSQDAFVAKLSTLGAFGWSKKFGDAPSNQVAWQEGTAVSVDPAGNILLTGTFATSIAIGGINPLLSAGGEDIFVAKLDSSGAYSWANGYGSTGSEYSATIDTTSNGDFAIAGSLSGNLSIGSTKLAPIGTPATFIAKFDTTGAPKWAKVFGDAQFNSAVAVTIDSLGEVALAGWTYGNMNFGGGPIPNAGSGTGDMYLAKLDSSGAVLWGKLFGDAGQQSATALALDPKSRNLVLVGTAQNTIIFGKDTVTSAGDDDFVVAKFQP